MRAGEDTRRRGWFWHWNNIVTQYAPLIGLKGVGLLNSYTVWTDRREESAYRGYAFPTQQSEAAFYGEDRAELIALNKILVALDLIEIRKEMVTRTDEQGRRWRVPHNLYRVKDHGDGFNLTGDDVLKVVALAEKDRAIYRTIRHIFSDRFAPIDSQNVWWTILSDIRERDLWQRVAARAIAEETRASARTRAGHEARKGRSFLPSSSDTATPTATHSDSSAVTSSPERRTSVAPTNNGSAVDVAASNKGSSRKSASTVPPVNQGRPTSVAPANTTKNQASLITTTTTGSQDRVLRTEDRDEKHRGNMGEISTVETSTESVSSRFETGSGPGGLAGPADAPGEASAIRAFEDANGRPSTPAERHLLRGLAAQAEPEAIRQASGSGWSWVTAAVYEAVEAGSSFVAPRRLREIINRWSRDGAPMATKPVSGIATEQPERNAVEPLLGGAPDVDLPHGFGSNRTWAFAVSRLSGSLERGALIELVGGTAITGYHDGTVTIAVANRRQAGQLLGGYRALVERVLGEAMRRPVRIAVIEPASSDEAAESVPPKLEAVPESQPVETTSGEPVSFLIPESGMTSEQVWMAILDELTASGEIPAANISAWLRPARLIGRKADGTLIVGAPHALAQRQIDRRYHQPIEDAASRVIGQPVRVEAVVASAWLAANPGRPTALTDEMGEQAGA